MNSSQGNKKASSDPFAADIFADKQSESDSAKITISNENRATSENWIKRLPRISAAAPDWNNLWKNLPADFADELPRQLAGWLARFLNLTDAKNVDFLLLVKREINRAEEIPEENTDSWWLRTKIEESDADLIFEFDNALAVWLVDTILSEKSAEQISIRELTASEKSVLEFLCLNLASEANRILQTPLFKFRSLSRRRPASLKFESKTPSLLAVNWQVIHQLQPGIVKMYLSPEAAGNLQAKENRLLDLPLRRRADWQRYKDKVKDVRMRLNLGAAELSLGELSALEKNDVVLLEKYSFTLQKRNLGGQAEIYLGDGENVQISGRFIPANFGMPDENFERAAKGNGRLVHQLQTISGWQISIENCTAAENPELFEKSMTEENENPMLEPDEENAEEEAETGLAIENLAVTLRIELEARRLSLEEAGNLRVNQILELGISPTDAVNLLIDNQVVGRGELVEVENRLGVRIIKLLR